MIAVETIHLAQTEILQEMIAWTHPGYINNENTAKNLMDSLRRGPLTSRKKLVGKLPRR